MKSRRAGWPAAALGYALVAGAFFAPVCGRLVHEQLGGGDSLESLWNAWWLSRSLLHLENPWFTDLLFAPYGTTLVWHSLAVLPSGAIALLARVLPLPLAYNAVVVAALPLAGTASFVLCRQLTGDFWASFAGGTVFMLSPFVVSKTLGHVDLLYGALLPLFYVALLRAVDAQRAPPGSAEALEARRRSWLLAAVGLLVFFTCNPNVPVFAANLGLLLFVREIRLASFAQATRRFARALAPTFLAAAPILATALYYTLTTGHPPSSRSDRSYDPELVAYWLPFTPTSVWSAWPRSLGLPGLDGIEPAVYLGLAVAPLAVSGLWLRRRAPYVGHLAAVLVFFLALSMGPKLLWQREVVEVGGLTVYLPFGLWRWVPLLGAVGEAGRYAIVVYLVLAVGVAELLVWIRARAGGRVGLGTTAGVVALVCLDYAFAPQLGALPAPLALSSASPEHRRVLDPRLGSAETMYQQTLHGRALVGGYVSRPPPRVLDRYREDPVLAWFFARPPGATPSRDDLLAGLRALAVGDVMLDPGDPRGETLAAFGFVRRDANRHTVVWSLPEGT
jgi:hypothetical protein